MALNAAMIQALVDKGMSAQDILDIAKASEVKLDRTAADRQARYRERKKGKRNAVTSRRDPPIDNIHTPSSDISPDGENQNDGRVRDAGWPDLPVWLPAEPWNAYLEMRRGKKAWPTAKAVGLILTDLDRWRAKGHDPGAILNTSTVSNWTGIFEPKAATNGKPHRNGNSSVRELGLQLAERRRAAGNGVVDLLPRLGSPGGHG